MARAWTIAFLTLAAPLAIASGRASAEAPALSLVAENGRIDIEDSQIVSIRTVPSLSWLLLGAQNPPRDTIELCFSADVRARICDLTTANVNRSMAIEVGCEIVSKPIVREPICRQPCFQVSVGSGAKEAEELVRKLQDRSRAGCTGPDS